MRHKIKENEKDEANNQPATDDSIKMGPNPLQTMVGLGTGKLRCVQTPRA
jgi:hypothetical protein